MIEEKEAMFVWAKTLLSVYKYMATITQSIDSLVLKQGVNSSFSYNGGYMSTFNTANKIIELSDRKRKLINIKIMIEDCLAKLDNDDVRLLVLTYFDLLKSTLVSSQLQVSMRTFFRKKHLAIQKFSNALKFYGITSEKLRTELSGEQWLLNLYESNLKSNETEEVLSKVGEYKLLKYIMKDLNKTNIKQYSF